MTPRRPNHKILLGSIEASEEQFCGESLPQRIFWKRHSKGRMVPLDLRVLQLSFPPPSWILLISGLILVSTSYMVHDFVPTIDFAISHIVKLEFDLLLNKSDIFSQLIFLIVTHFLILMVQWSLWTAKDSGCSKATFSLRRATSRHTGPKQNGDRRC